jgi:hypothetical protein
MNFAGGNQVEIWRGNLPNSNTFSTIREETAQVPCPDLRGYWGDYDYSSTGQNASGGNGLTFRGIAFSNATCNRTTYSSQIYAGFSFWVEE